MLGRRSEIANLQSDFFRDKFRKTLRWLMYFVIIIYILIFAIIYLILIQPEHQYYANTTTGMILPMPKTGIN